MFQRQVSFSEAVNIALRQKYATFTGRASRSEYWFYMLFNFILSVVCSVLSGVLEATGNSGMGVLGSGITIVVSLGLLLPSLAITVRRLHDIGKSGWWYLGYILVCLACTVSFVIAFMGVILQDGTEPMIGLIAVAAIVLIAVYIIAIVWMCKPSQPHPNQYGPVPNLVSE